MIDDSWQCQRNLRYQILHHCFTSVKRKIAQKIDAFYDFLISFYKCLTKNCAEMTVSASDKRQTKNVNLKINQGFA